MSPNSSPAGLIVRPRIWIGIVIWLGEVLVVDLVQLWAGVPYTDVGDDASTLFRGAATSLIVGTVLPPITSTSRARRSSGGITSADPGADFAGVEVYRPPR